MFLNLCLLSLGFFLSPNSILQNQDVRVVLILATFGSTGNNLFDVMGVQKLYGSGYVILVHDSFNFPSLFQMGQYNSLVLQGAIMVSSNAALTTDRRSMFFSLFENKYPQMIVGPPAFLAYDAIQLIAACIASARVELTQVLNPSSWIAWVTNTSGVVGTSGPLIYASGSATRSPTQRILILNVIPPNIVSVGFFTGMFHFSTF